MLHRIQRVRLVLLLSIFLSACANDRPDGALSPVLSPTPVQAVFQLDRSALSYGIFETDARSVTVEVSNTIPAMFNAFADISIDDGSKITAYKVESGESTIVHSMPPGEKRVTITSGAQTKSDNEITGVFINKIIFNGEVQQIKQDSQRIAVYGDSIAVGGNVDNLSAEAWPVLLRKYFSVVLEAYSYRSLQDDASTPEKRAELVSRISAWEPDFVWLAIGANDYSFEKWSAQAFGEAYAGTLDAIHSSIPQALLFAQSPILQGDETPNSFGSNLESYRQQIAAACLERTAWCTFVDGTSLAFPQPYELDKDGVHLTTKSSAKYAEAVLDIINK
jgi:lysophospholipase L1-like esterase